jgi:hypothetical protein
VGTLRTGTPRQNMRTMISVSNSMRRPTWPWSHTASAVSTG